MTAPKKKPAPRKRAPRKKPLPKPDPKAVELAGQLAAEEAPRGKSLSKAATWRIDQKLGFRKGTTLMLYDDNDTMFMEAMKHMQKCMVGRWTECTGLALSELQRRLNDDELRGSMSERTLVRIADVGTRNMLNIDDRLRVTDINGVSFDIIDVDPV